MLADIPERRVAAWLVTRDRGAVVDVGLLAELRVVVGGFEKRISLATIVFEEGALRVVYLDRCRRPVIGEFGVAAVCARCAIEFALVVAVLGDRLAFLVIEFQR